MRRFVGAAALAALMVGTAPVAQTGQSFSKPFSMGRASCRPTLRRVPGIWPGAGYLKVVFDTTDHTMSVFIEFSDPVGTTVAAHIHCCVSPDAATPSCVSPDAATPRAGVAMQTPTFTGFPLGVTSGTYDHEFDLTDIARFNPHFVVDHGGTAAGAEAALFDRLQSGFAYVNIHTSVVASGEIRGFYQQAPEPAALALFAFGLGGFAFLRPRQAART